MGGMAILGLKNKGGFQNLQDSGGFGFRRRKSPLLALDNTNIFNLQWAMLP